MLVLLVIVVGAMLQKVIFLGQFVPHTVNDILNVLLVATYGIVYGDMLLVGYQASYQADDARLASSLILYHRFANRATPGLLRCEAHTFEDVDGIHLVHLQEHRLVGTHRVVEEYLHQGMPVFPAYLVGLRKVPVEYFHLVGQFLVQRILQVIVIGGKQSHGFRCCGYQWSL